MASSLDAVLQISIHALREEGDLAAARILSPLRIFLSTPSARRATLSYSGAKCRKKDFYPRPPRGGRPPTRIPASTHTYFYPRPPRGGRQSSTRRRRWPARFLSTPSARRATARNRAEDQRQGDFYPRPPRGGRQPAAADHVGNTGFLSTPSARRATLALDLGAQVVEISIHALREEGDREGEREIHRHHRISIHALREEGDGGSQARARPEGDFYPRPPRGGRLTRCKRVTDKKLFLSTPSARRATAALPADLRAVIFLSTPSARRATRS